MSDVESPETSDKIKLEEEEEAMESNLADPGNFWGHEIFFPETADVGSNVKEEASENAAQEDQNNDMEDSAAEGSFALNAANLRKFETETTNFGDHCTEFKSPKTSNLQSPQSIFNDELSKKKSLICPHCGHKSDNKINLRCHILTHSNTGSTYFLKHGPESTTVNDQFSASIAPYMSSLQDSESISKDFLEKYGNKKIHKCPNCTYESDNLSNIYRHISTHSTTNLLKCTECEYTTNRKDTLKEHILTHKSGDKLFKCAECQYECNSRRNMRRHVVVHNASKLFKCTLCDYECNRKQRLNIHLLTHTNIKLFKCADCPFESNHKQSLKEHMFTHLTVKLFQCPECQYECNFKKALKRHMHVHAKKIQPQETMEGDQLSIKEEVVDEILPTEIGDSNLA